ncbi:hypothetical protein ANCDUO_12319 [Ancylostoma duodenale]|uniref:Uncharacterized protein n=1 Tax=Ancylostoma duodenale TaxID=51022 RepID=A0A0C2CLP5_9BILA|nr:hypothetical protein ANCDUO_12319 [Ancylostoma duodenale]
MRDGFTRVTRALKPLWKSRTDWSDLFADHDGTHRELFTLFKTCTYQVGLCVINIYSTILHNFHNFESSQWLILRRHSMDV